MNETRYQRVAREQRERQLLRAKRMEREFRERNRRFRKLAREERERIREKRYGDSLVDDHNHEMNG